jgi:voltage-gated potassium channel
VGDSPKARRIRDNGAGKQPASIERIQRLAKLEMERIAERNRREEQRLQVIAGAKPVGGRHDVVDRIERMTKYPLTILGFAWLIVAIVVLTTDVKGSAVASLVGTLFVLWAVVVVEYIVRLVITPNRRGYLKQRWIEPAMVVLPPLQGWRFVGIEKMCLLLHEGELRVEAILKHHGLFRVLIAAVVTLFLGAWLVLLFEVDAKGSNIHDYPDALWWAVVTVTTVGYGDRFPVTAGGRAVAVFLMLLGIGLIGILTATVASVFMKEHTDANQAVIQKGHADLGQQLAIISDRLADVERRLGATAAEVAAVDAVVDVDVATNEPVGPDHEASTT